MALTFKLPVPIIAEYGVALREHDAALLGGELTFELGAVSLLVPRLVAVIYERRGGEMIVRAKTPGDAVALRQHAKALAAANPGRYPEVTAEETAAVLARRNPQREQSAVS